ncbi:WhiB family transcriptional regulator [Candidatus Saccharibacteria bacterium]|nr:WhiB family transcriptional regulator [Candidatus Saccharibacteria bacterium]
MGLQRALERGVLPLQQIISNEGVCAQTDPEVFFPEKGGSSRTSKQVCINACEVTEECLALALLAGERFGIWGGLTDRERRGVAKDLGL